MSRNLIERVVTIFFIRSVCCFRNMLLYPYLEDKLSVLSRLNDILMIRHNNLPTREIVFPQPEILKIFRFVVMLRKEIQLAIGKCIIVNVFGHCPVVFS